MNTLLEAVAAQCDRAKTPVPATLRMATFGCFAAILLIGSFLCSPKPQQENTTSAVNEDWFDYQIPVSPVNLQLVHHFVLNASAEDVERIALNRIRFRHHDYGPEYEIVAIPGGGLNITENNAGGKQVLADTNANGTATWLEVTAFLPESDDRDLVTISRFGPQNRITQRTYHHMMDDILGYIDTRPTRYSP